MNTPEFIEFPKIARLSRECTITEKIDGTNAQILITEDGGFFTGSRTRWITTEQDHFGFSKWAHDHKAELMLLGPGSHFGEWWGQGIQRNYGLKEKRFSLFNTERWHDDAVRPSCCHVVPVLDCGLFTTSMVDNCIEWLRAHGSSASPGFMIPEGIVIWHSAARVMFKKTLARDEEPKSFHVAGGSK